MPMLAILALLTAQPVPPLVADSCHQRRDQDRAFRAMREGRILPLPEIERRVVPQMRDSQYLGPEIDPDSGIYTLKFLRNGSVIWIKVDGRSGQIVGRMGY